MPGESNNQCESIILTRDSEFSQQYAAWRLLIQFPGKACMNLRVVSLYRGTLNVKAVYSSMTLVMKIKLGVQGELL